MNKDNPSFKHLEYWSKSTPDSVLSRRIFLAQAQMRLWKLKSLFSAFLKRSMDIVGSGCALIVLSPVFLVVACLIKRTDGGPVFFKQTRVGRSSRLFVLYKFRSMETNAEQMRESLEKKNMHNEGITFKIIDDPRVTSTGKWLRKWSLDELPQFINVLKGDMSLVGPRPPIIKEVIKYKAIHLRRLVVKPGITCFWQIGGRSKIGFQQQVILDLKYIKNQGLWTDLKILFLTVPAVLFSKGAC